MGSGQMCLMRVAPPSSHKPLWMPTCIGSKDGKPALDVLGMRVVFFKRITYYIFSCLNQNLYLIMKNKGVHNHANIHYSQVTCWLFECTPSSGPQVDEF